MKSSKAQSLGEARFLRDAKTFYKSLVELSPVGICVVIEGVLNFANPGMATTLGFTSPEELTGMDLFRFVHPHSRSVVETLLAHELKQTVPCSITELQMLRRDGSIIDAEVVMAPLSYNEIEATELMVRDISELKRTKVRRVELDLTERKQMEEAIQEREKQYRALVEESFDGIMITKERKIIFVNTRLCKMLGYSREELEGMDYRLPAHPDFRDSVHERALARMRGESLPSQYEMKFQRKDGSVFDAEINSRAIEVQGTSGVQVWIRDITERKKAEEDLRESERKYRAIFDMAPTGINMNDWGNVLQVNTAWKKMLGYGEEELRKLSPIDITHPDDSETTGKYHDALVRGDLDSYRFEKRYIRKDGQVLWGDLSVSAVRDEAGNYRTSVAIVTDITDKKRAEEELLASEERYRGLFEDSIRNYAAVLPFRLSW
jgi:PAS domain S-box-containing protein